MTVYHYSMPKSGFFLFNKSYMGPILPCFGCLAPGPSGHRHQHHPRIDGAGGGHWKPPDSVCHQTWLENGP